MGTQIVYYSKSINGLRGIVCILIALFHFENIFQLGTVKIFSTSYLGVEFFFILSGFLLANGSENIRNIKELIKFLYKKIVGLYIPYIVTLALMILLYSFLWFNGNVILWLNSDNHKIDTISEIFLLQTIGISNFSYINYPAWYVSALSIGIILFSIRLLYEKDFFIEYICPIISIFLYIILFRQHINMNPAGFIYDIFPIPIIRMVAGMLWGFYIFNLYKKIDKKINKKIDSRIANFIEGIGVIIFISLFLYRESSIVDIFIIPISSFLIILFFADYSNNTGIQHILGFRIIQLIGEMSYSFYLIQSFCTNLMSHYFYDLKQPYILILYLVINSFMGYVIYLLCEKRKYVKRKGENKDG